MRLITHPLPVVIALFVPILILTTYFVSAGLKHRPFFFPTISATGDLAPESCIFSWGMTLNAFALAILALLQWAFQQKLFARGVSRARRRANHGALFIGILSAAALHGVACFQSKLVPPAHFTFAAIFFVGAAVYMIFMTCISWRNVASLAVRLLRVALTVLAWVFALTMLIFGLVHNARKKTHRHDPFGNLAALCEWLTVFAVAAYFASYVGEFRHFVLDLDISARRQPRAVKGGLAAPLLHGDATVYQTNPIEQS